MNTQTLYRPVGDRELQRVAESRFRRFPRRLPDQPYFYPVCNERYASQIARDWNARHHGVGFVTRFQVMSVYLSRYPMRQVGSKVHQEYWIPAGELDDFNDAIVGTIEVVRVYIE